VFKIQKIKSKTEYQSHHHKHIIRKLVWIVIDTAELLIGRGRGGLTPPRSIVHVSRSGWKEYGKKFCKYFKDIGGINPDSKILDVGSGIGSAAVGLTGYLSKDGEYQGFDCDRMQVNWCKSHISKKFSNFHFQHSNIINMNYNPNGIIQSSSYKFPYKDDYFDFVYLLSVFTHMFTPDMENYLKEISRVLKPGGRCFITYFLLNNESEKLIKMGKSSQNLIYDIDGCVTSNKENPEEANGFKEDHIRKIYKENQLMLSDPIHFGSWCGRTDFIDYQDIVIGTKK